MNTSEIDALFKLIAKDKKRLINSVEDFLIETFKLNNLTEIELSRPLNIVEIYLTTEGSRDRVKFRYIEHGRTQCSYLTYDSLYVIYDEVFDKFYKNSES